MSVHVDEAGRDQLDARVNDLCGLLCRDIPCDFGDRAADYRHIQCPAQALARVQHLAILYQ